MAPLRFDQSFEDNADHPSKLEPVVATVAAVCTLTLAFAICGCCRRKKERGGSGAKAAAAKATLAEKLGKIDVSPRAAATAMPPREPVAVSQISRDLFGFALNMYRWGGGVRSRKTMFLFPSALQLSLSPYYEASKRVTRTEMRQFLFPTLSENKADEALSTVTAAIAPTALDGGWRLATRLYASKKRTDAYCPEYRRTFDSLNERAGRVMEMVAFSEADAKNAGPAVDDLNAWAKRSVVFMERPLFENAEKKMKTFFLNKPDPRLVLVNVCGFRCRLENPFRAANVSVTGHPFLSYDGRKLVPNWPMLHSSEEDETKFCYFYHEDNEFQFLRLPLRRSSKSEAELALYLMLPKERGALRLLERKFSAAMFIERIKKCVQPERVRIVLPKLQLQCRYETFVDAVKMFGARSLVDPKTAELAFMFTTEGTDETAPGLKGDGSVKSANAVLAVSKGGSAAPKTKGARGKSKPPKGKSAKLDPMENPCLTDAIHAGCFQLLDDEAEKVAEIKEATKTVTPPVLGNKGAKTTNGSKSSDTTNERTAEKTLSSKTSQPTIGSKTVQTSLQSKTAESASSESSKGNEASPSGAPTSSTKSSRPSIFARLTNKSGNSRSNKSGGGGKGSEKSGKESGEKASRKSASGHGGDDAEATCPICNRIESRGVHIQLKRFVADHPFIWIVVVEKPFVVPLVIGRFCGQKSM